MHNNCRSSQLITTAFVVTAWLLRHGTLLSTCLPSGGSPCTASVIIAWLLKHGTMHNKCLPSQSSPTHCMAPQTWLIAQHLPAIRWVTPPPLPCTASVITAWLLRHGTMHNNCLPSQLSHTASVITCKAPQTWHNAQQLSTITIYYHCSCHHCMAPQTWHNAHQLPTITIESHCTASVITASPLITTAAVIIAWLLRHGTSPNTCLPSGGHSVLHLSSLHGSSDMAQCITTADHHN